jgi:hypothetical protein
MARTMLNEAKLPDTFWREVLDMVLALMSKEINMLNIGHNVMNLILMPKRGKYQSLVLNKMCKKICYESLYKIQLRLG